MAFRRTGTVRSVDVVLNAVCAVLAIDRPSLCRRRRNSFDRAIAARMLCDHGGLTQRETAQVLGIANGAAISQQLSKLAGALEADGVLRAEVTEIAAVLKGDQSEP